MDGNTPLSRSVCSRNFPLCELLIARGADPNVKNSDGKALLCLVVEDANFSLCEMLIEKGANPNIQNSNGEKDGES